MKLNDTHLLKACRPFDFINPPFDPISFANDLVRFMYDANGLGVAANQIGVPYRAFAMRGSPQNFVVFNPRIVWSSDDEILLDEGCLSYPGLTVRVKRPASIRARFNTPNGDVETRQFNGISARVFQHEMEHLDGRRFYDAASRYHRDSALRRWRRDRG
jgi:peptide deformylase